MKNNTVKIACVGDSITFGYGSSNPDTCSYPYHLGRLLGNGYKVGNFGLSGSTMMADSFFPYYNSEEYKASLAFEPDVLVLMLGTNDSCFIPDRADKNRYIESAEMIFSSYEKLSTNPKIFYNLVPHLYSNEQYANSIKDYILPMQKEIAKKHGYELIDLYSVINDPSHLSDGVHPTDIGYELIANTVYAALKKYFDSL